MSKSHTAKAAGAIDVCGTYTSDGIHDTPQGSDVLKPLIHAADALFRRPSASEPLHASGKARSSRRASSCRIRMGSRSRLKRQGAQ